MTYHGNLIMTGNVNIYIINWFDGEQPPANYVSLNQQFYNDLSGTQEGQTFYNILNQYPDYTGSYPTGVTLAGTWEDDSTPYPTCGQDVCDLDSSDILAEVETAMSQNSSWPQGGSYANYFVVYTLGGVQSSVGCGFHGASPVLDNASIIYGYIPLAGVGNFCPPPTIYSNCAKCDSAINRSAHELFEAVTDPLTPTPYPTGWNNEGSGSTTGPEIADICGGQYGPTPYPYDNGKANQDWVSGSQDHYYLIQEMWSNSADACTTSHT